MKISRHLLRFALLCAGSGFLACAAQTNQDTNTTSHIADTAAPVAEIPKSVFIPRLGKDPFFPRSAKQAGGAPKSTAGGSFTAADFVLDTTIISEHSTAMVNHRTFEKGEEGEVRIPSGGKISIRVVDIKVGSILIAIGNSTNLVELKRRPGQF